MNLCEHVGPGFVIKGVVKHAMKGKNPNMIRENVKIIEKIMTEFGSTGFPLQEVIEFNISAIGNTNPKVREAVINLLGTIFSYVGEAIKQFLKDVKPSTMKLIDEKFLKMAPANESSQDTKRKLRDEDEEQKQNSGADLLADLPRQDCSKDLTNSKLLAKLGDKNWKIKNEGYKKIIEIMDKANNRI